MKQHNVLTGDCRKTLATLADNSVDSIVTDPPYELGFMGKKWDASGVAYDQKLWSECLRVLKPGGHLLSFGGTRTYHRMAVAIEDAGFEIRDSLHWTYGTGFPKSHNVSKALDKLAGAEREVIGTVKTNVGMQGGNFSVGSATAEINVTAAASDEAKQWDGWNTALKPSHELIAMARKPLTQTVAKNVLEHGTGALNIDGCRVGDAGRWPANTVLTHSPDCNDNCTDSCPVNQLGDKSRFFTVTDWDTTIYCAKPSKKERNAGLDGLPIDRPDKRTDTGKGTFAEKGVQPQQNSHPTVKPVELMRHLVRLVTPPGGTVLDPFLGSGTTAVAAILEGFDWVGCELTDEYLPIIEARIDWAVLQQQKLVA